MSENNSNTTDDAFAGFGVPAVTSGPKEYPWRRHSLKTPDGNKGETQTQFVCRIVPPFKSLAGNPRGWAQFHDLYFGYDGVSKYNSKPRPRPFVVKGTQRGDNPAEKKILSQKEKLENVRDDLRTKDTDFIVEQTQGLVDWVRYHNRDSKWYINVVGEDGDLYVLQISNKCKKALELEMRQLEDSEGLTVADVMNPKAGVWFKFIRTGTKQKFGEIQDTVVTVREAQEFTDNNGIKRKTQAIKSAALSAPQIERVLAKAPDLVTEVVSYLTADQAEYLVNGPADPVFVDQVWDNFPACKQGQVPESSKSSDPEEFFKKFGS